MLMDAYDACICNSDRFNLCFLFLLRVGLGMWVYFYWWFWWHGWEVVLL